MRWCHTLALIGVGVASIQATAQVGELGDEALRAWAAQFGDVSSFEMVVERDIGFYGPDSKPVHVTRVQEVRRYRWPDTYCEYWEGEETVEGSPPPGRTQMTQFWRGRLADGTFVETRGTDELREIGNSRLDDPPAYHQISRAPLLLASIATMEGFGPRWEPLFGGGFRGHVSNLEHKVWVSFDLTPVEGKWRLTRVARTDENGVEGLVTTYDEFRMFEGVSGEIATLSSTQSVWPGPAADVRSTALGAPAQVERVASVRSVEAWSDEEMIIHPPEGTPVYVFVDGQYRLRDDANAAAPGAEPEPASEEGGDK
jgi:hypothetical protein